jgi:outer membrane protein assembly factor BamA
VIAHLGVLVDTRDRGNPRRGGLYHVQVRRFADRQGEAYSFTDTRVDLQQFIPFWNLSRVLAVRVLAQHADGLGQAQVPFYLMPTLGGARTLRGYDRQRFRDRSLVYVSAEYRFEVNPFLMGAVFYDAGQVAPDWSQFRLRDFRDNYGLGLRFGYSEAVALRADLAFLGEDHVRLLIGFTTSF